MWVPVGEEALGETYQDLSVKQECFSDIRNPSERDAQAQVAQGANMFDFDEELCLRPPTLSNGACLTATGKGVVASGPAPKAKQKQKHGDNALLAASQIRSKTAADFTTSEILLKRALLKANDTLEKAYEIHGSDEKVEKDASLNLVRSRLDLVELALDGSTNPAEAKSNSNLLYKAAIEDPYLKDLRSSTLQDPDCCQTLGMLKYVRTIKLDLYLNLPPGQFLFTVIKEPQHFFYTAATADAADCISLFLFVQLSSFVSFPFLPRLPSIEAVRAMSETHKTAINLLKTFASCLETEAQSWIANVTALLKAKSEEDKAVEKAQRKAKVDEEKRKLKAQKAAAKAEAKKKAREDAKLEALQKAEDDAVDDKPLSDDEAAAADRKQKKRRQRLHGLDGLDEADPPILKAVPNLPSTLSATLTKDSVQAFVTAIVSEPDVLCVGRFKRNAIKKVLQDGDGIWFSMWFPNLFLSTTAKQYLVILLKLVCIYYLHSVLS